MTKQNKPFYKKWWFWVAIVIVILSMIAYPDGAPESEEVSEVEKPLEEIEETEEGKEENSVEGYTVKFGELLTVQGPQYDSDIIVFKTKIDPSLTDNMTIKQNFFNVEDIIVNQGIEDYKELQYWAIADMEDGSEGKVISFTVEEPIIEKIKNKEIPGNKIREYVTDLWILPSLEQ